MAVVPLAWLHHSVTNVMPELSSTCRCTSGCATGETRGTNPKTHVQSSVAGEDTAHGHAFSGLLVGNLFFYCWFHGDREVCTTLIVSGPARRKHYVWLHDQ